MDAKTNFLAQKALRTCDDHEHEETDIYCKTCKKPVCVSCVRNDHKEHEWDTMRNIAKSLRMQTKQRQIEFESISKSIVAGITEILDFVLNGYEKELSLNCSELQSTRIRLVRYVNEQINKMKDKCHKSYEEKTEMVKKQKENLKTKENRMKFLIQEMETGASDFTDFDLIEMHKEIQNLLSELQSQGEIPSHFHYKMVYHPGSSDMTSIISCLGSVEAETVLEKTTPKGQFKGYGTSIDQIRPISMTNAWTHLQGTTLFKLLDTEGKEKISLDLQYDCMDFTISQNGTIYFTNVKTKCLMKSDGIEEIKTLFSSDEFLPTGISLAGSGDLLVVLTKKWSDRDQTKAVRYIVRRMTKTGLTIKDNELECEKMSSHLGVPSRVMEHPNGNISVAMIFFENDGSNAGYSIIYCIDCLGKMLYKYGGKDANVLITNFCHDSKGNTLASDMKNMRIHLIDINGKFVRYLLTEESLKHPPGPIALRGDNLWIGTGSDGIAIIQVYKYDC